MVGELQLWSPPRLACREPGLTDLAVILLWRPLHWRVEEEGEPLCGGRRLRLQGDQDQRTASQNGLVCGGCYVVREAYL